MKYQIFPHELSTKGVAISWVIQSPDYWSKAKGQRQSERKSVKKLFGRTIITSRSEAELFYKTYGGEI